MKRLLTIGALALLPHFASAENVDLKAPLQAGSIHDGGIDMVIYYVEQGDHFETVATYATLDNPQAPRRVRMALAEGDSTTFALPNTSGMMFTFARNDNQVRIATHPRVERAAWLTTTEVSQ